MRKPTYCTLIANLKVEITLSIKIPCFHRSSWPVSIRHLHNRELESCDKTHVRTGRVAQPECKRIHRHGFLSFNEKNKITNSITWCCCLALQLENLYMISRELFYKIKIRSLNQSDGKIRLSNIYPGCFQWCIQMCGDVVIMCLAKKTISFVIFR